MTKCMGRALGAIAAVVVLGCGGGDGGSGPAPSIAVTATPSSLTLQQGTSGTVAVTLTRGGGFAGGVSVSVTGLPTGVTADVSPAQLTGAVTSATVTVTVAASVAAATYTATIRAAAAGVGEATTTYALTVTSIPNYALTATPAAVTIPQGTSGPTTIGVVRTNFTSAVALTLDSPPTGITGGFNPASATGDNSVLTISVAPTVATGNYTLTVKGSATGPGDKTTTVTLTVTPQPDYSLSVTPNAVSINGGVNSSWTTIVNIARTNYTGAVTLALDAPPAGFTAQFNPAAPTGNNSSATINIAASVPPATYVLTIKGTAAGVPTEVDPDAASVAAFAPGDRTTTVTVTVAPAPDFTIATTPSALIVAQGGSGNTTVNLVRTNFTGNVNLTVDNLPAGVTAGFAPASPISGNSSVLTLTVAGNAPTGTFTNLLVRGVGAGITDRTAPLSLTIGVAGNFTLTTIPASSVSVTQGSNANVTVNINRTGGNTSDVALTATGALPTGMTLDLAPANTTTNSSLLTVTTTGATPVSATPILIHGNVNGLGEQLVSLTINVTAPSGSTNVTVTFASCSTEDKAAWLAFQDGSSGPWTRVTGTADVYQFNISQAKGGLAFVVLGAGTSAVNVLYFTQSEMTAGTLNFCAAASAGKTVNGAVANMTGFAPLGSVSFGGTSAFVPNGAFQLNNVRDGLNDLMGFWLLPGGGTSHRMFLNRGLNPANGGSVGTVDFTGTGSFAAQFSVGTMGGGASGGGTERITHNMSYYTGTGAKACVGGLLYQGLLTVGTTFVVFGAPPANQVATDFHSISIFGTALSFDTFRGLTEDFRDLPARVATPFVLPAILAAATPTNLGGPYKRLQVATTFAAELNSSASFFYSDQTVAGTSISLTATAGWLGGSAVTLGTPDFSATVGGGFLNTWAPAGGDAVAWTLTGAGTTLTSCTQGHKIVFSGRNGTA